ncbi:vascular endothelial growth factor A-A-like isoform X2 [Thalassophryne amazonica]|uniref:vascular endothelial growth factor A-A-like isoform X2 n=1 Tax=Thalassophryne amazonica TaxID=390379 RepID=UPI0014726289|nr:vascular endothelial growth factor A-A-like isoform X2 [Thalassophryne amazonica]
MNFAVTLTWMLLAVVLQLSTVKTASIYKGGDKAQNDVIPFLDVYNKSCCQVREVLVDIYHEYPENTERTYIPACVVLERCGGYCGDDALECVAKEMHNVTLAVMLHKAQFGQHMAHLSFTEHRACHCRARSQSPMPEAKAKKE